MLHGAQIWSAAILACTIACIFCCNCVPEFKTAEENCDSLSGQAIDAFNKGNDAQAENKYLLAIEQAKNSNNLLPDILPN
jgi:hypothetical protein